MPVCPYCDIELDCDDVEFFGDTELIETHYFTCPICGRHFSRDIIYKYVREDDIREIH